MRADSLPRSAARFVHVPEPITGLLSPIAFIRLLHLAQAEAARLARTPEGEGNDPGTLGNARAALGDGRRTTGFCEQD